VVSDDEEARAESEVLLEHVLSTDSTGLIASMTQPIWPEAADRLARLLERRLQREPLRYITGSCPFYGRDFRVDRRVLIPRQETELIVEKALGWADRHGAGRIADIGTGSGVLAVTLALELDEAEVWAVDISADALEVAAENARRLGAGALIEFHEGDLAEPLQGRFDIVVANLPYVLAARMGEVEPELAAEPRLALAGGPDGLDLISRLVPQLPDLLSGEAIGLLEIDPALVDGVRALVEERMPEADLQIIDDLAGLARVAEITVGV
jgi:release factor glutamine methyltransferase